MANTQEAGYHFLQGTHLGHILYILNTVGKGNLNNSHLRDEYVKFSGGYSEEIGTFQRQTKYKLQAVMEMGLLLDFRSSALSESFDLILSENGLELFRRLNSLLESLDLSLDISSKTGELSWKMNFESSINEKIAEFLETDSKLRDKVRSLFLKMDALALLPKTNFTKTSLKFLL